MEQESSTRFRFSRWEADIANGELFKLGHKVRIQRQPFKVLTVLLLRAGQVVTREELREELWPGTHVEVDLSLNTAIKKLRTVLGDNSRIPSFIETIPSRGYRFVRKRLIAVPGAIEDITVQGTADNGKDVRVAVLPFENLDADGKDQFSDGIGEHIVVRLTAVNSSITVIGTPSLLRYKHTSKSMSQLCRELRANYILSGSTSRSGDVVRVDTKLMNSDQSCIWARSYTYSDLDPLLGQSQISEDIIQACSHVLCPTAVPTRHRAPAIRNAYRHGKYLLSQGSRVGIQKSIELFQQVIALDSQFAPAYCGLAEAFLHAAWTNGLANLVFPKSVECAQHALELAPYSPDPYVTMAWIKYAYDQNPTAAEEDCRRALIADPYCSAAYSVLSFIYTSSGKHNEAIMTIRHAKEFTPYSVSVQSNVGFILYYAGRFEEALQAGRVAAELDNTSPLAHAILGMALEQTGKTIQAVGEYKLGLRYQPDNGMLLACLGRSLALLGKQPEAVKILNRLISEYRTAKSSSSLYWIALVCAALGKTDQALEWLKIAFEESCAQRVFCHVDPRLKVLRGNHDYDAIVLKGLPDSWQTPKMHVFSNSAI